MKIEEFFKDMEFIPTLDYDENLNFYKGFFGKIIRKKTRKNHNRFNMSELVLEWDPETIKSDILTFHYDTLTEIGETIMIEATTNTDIEFEYESKKYIVYKGTRVSVIAFNNLNNGRNMNNDKYKVGRIYFEINNIKPKRNRGKSLRSSKSSTRR